MRTFLAITFIFLGSKIFSQCTPYCFCDHDATPAGVIISHVHNKGEWMFSYRFSVENSNALRNGTRKVPADEMLNESKVAPTSMRSEMQMLMLMYGLSDKLSVMGMVEYERM